MKKTHILFQERISAEVSWFYRMCKKRFDSARHDIANTKRYILTMSCRAESKLIILLENYFNLFKAFSSLGSITLISSTANPPTEARNQGSDFSSPKAENGTKATPASLIR